MNQHDEQSVSSDPNDINKSESKRRKRRSKNEQDGRMFKCQECGKSYLSQPALTNHKKTKHSYDQNGEKRGRGRPRKNPNLAANENCEKKFKTFFEKDTRKKLENDTLDASKVEEAFKDIFNRYKTDLFFPENIEDEPFYHLIKEMQSGDLNKGSNNKNTNANANDEINININSTDNNFNTQENQTQRDNQDNQHQQRQNNCDTAFLAYVKEFYSQTNYDYFHFLLKFVVMFRQCINKLKRANNGEALDNSLDPKNYFTQFNNAEGVPDMCNDFVTEFMEPKDYFGMDTMELIEIIQHFCHWLFLKNFTTSRLTLV